MFKKKNTFEMYKMSTEEILLGIELIKKRSRLNTHSATFLNSYVSRRTCRQLKRKGIIHEKILYENVPGFKVSW